jgi:hypothetical protein
VKTLRTTESRGIGPYRVLAELGRGGMGRVLLGTGPDGRLVAVKLVHDQLAEDDGFRARFRREVDASRVVSGAYTAAVVDADPDAETPWLASVFVPGPSLHDTLAAVGALPEAAVLRLAAGLATALTHIHRAGLVHRDLKPSNVLITGDGPRVIDFGIVRAVSDGRGDELTRTGWLVGTPAFMSPEQAEGGVITSAGDVFSLGSVLVAAATGVSPFTGASTMNTLINVARAEPDLTGLSPAVRRIVEPCLAKDPAARPTPADLLSLIGQIAPSTQPWPEAVHRLITRRQAEIAEYLEPGQDATVIVTEPALGSTRVATPLPRHPTAVLRPRPRFRPALQAVAVAVVLVAAWAVWPSSDPAEPALEQLGEIPATATVHNLAFRPDSAVLTADAYDGTLQSWDTGSREQTGQILGSLDRDPADAAVFTEDGRTLVTADLGAENVVVEHWDMATGSGPRQVLVAETTTDVDDVLLSPDGRTLAISTDTDVGDAVRLWDIAARTHVGVPGRAQGFSPDSHTLVTTDVTDDQDDVVTVSVSLWEVASGRQAGEEIRLPEEHGFSCFAFGREDGALMIVSSDHGERVLRWWDVTSGNQLRPPVDMGSGDISGFAQSPDGRYLVLLDGTEYLDVRDLDTGKQVDSLHEVTAMALAPDGTLATAHSDEDTNEATVRLWRLP